MATATKRPNEEVTMEVQGVTKRFGDNIAVNNVTFDVLKGEVLGFPRSQWLGQNDNHASDDVVLYAG